MYPLSFAAWERECNDELSGLTATIVRLFAASRELSMYWMPTVGQAFEPDVNVALSVPSRFSANKSDSLRAGFPSPPVTALLRRKLDFLLAIQQRAWDAASNAETLREITQRVFDRRDLVDHLSIGEGWLSLLTASNFSRSQFLKSFLRAADNPPVPRAGPDSRVLENFDRK
jgi:hypothetical protein